MLIGRVDRVPGVCYVATDVVEIAWIPLWPRATWVVEEGSETHGRYYRSRLSALFDDTIESTVAVKPGTEVHAQQWRGRELPFSRRSFVRGLAQRLAIVGGLGLALASLTSIGFRQGYAAAGLLALGLFFALFLASGVARMFGRIRASDTMRAAALALPLGAAVALPWWVLFVGIAAVGAGVSLRRAPLADPVRAMELGKLLGASPAKIREAIAMAGQRAPVPRATAKAAAPPAKPAPVPLPLPPPPSPAPLPPRDPSDGPRFLT